MNKKKHVVLECGHPSPLSVKYWTGCKIFSKINTSLESLGKDTIDWILPEKAVLELPPHLSSNEAADEEAEEEVEETKEETKADEMEEDTEEKEVEESVDYNKLTVAKLKEICKEKGLSTGGRKADLIDRIQNGTIELPKVGVKRTREKSDTSAESPKKKQKTKKEVEEESDEEKTSTSSETDFSEPEVGE